MLEAFKSTRPARTDGQRVECRHKDGDKSNNWYTNLKWGTSKQNKKDMDKHGTRLRGEKVGNSRLKEVEVTDIINRYAKGESISVIAKDFTHVSIRVISAVAYGQIWKHIKRPDGLPSNHSVRTPRGESVHSAKITESQVREIRKSYKAGRYNTTQLASLYGINQSSICAIIQRRTWKHIK